MTFDATNHYWLVAGANGQLYSSASNIYVQSASGTYLEWIEAGNFPSQIASEQELADVLQKLAPSLLPEWLFDPTAATTFVQPSAGAYSTPQLTRYAAAARYAKEIGGITVNAAAVATDRASQAMIGNAYNMATKNSTFTTRWKNPDGSFTTLDAPSIISLAVAVGNHVSACFGKEADICADIAAASPTIVSLAEIDAAFEAVPTAY